MLRGPSLSRFRENALSDFPSFHPETPDVKLEVHHSPTPCFLTALLLRPVGSDSSGQTKAKFT